MYSKYMGWGMLYTKAMRLKEANQLSFAFSVCLFSLILSGSVSTYLLLATSPRDIGPFGVTLWFVAFLMTTTCLLTLIRYRLQLHKTAEDARLALFKHLLRQSSVWMLFATVALAMQSLRVLNLGDGLLFLLALGIIEVYFRTRKKT